MSAYIKLYQVCNYFQPTRRTKYDFKSIKAASSRCLQSGIIVTVSFKTCTYQRRIVQGQMLSMDLPPFWSDNDSASHTCCLISCSSHPSSFIRSTLFCCSSNSFLYRLRSCDTVRTFHALVVSSSGRPCSLVAISTSLFRTFCSRFTVPVLILTIRITSASAMVAQIEATVCASARFNLLSLRTVSCESSFGPPSKVQIRGPHRPSLIAVF